MTAFRLTINQTNEDKCYKPLEILETKNNIANRGGI